MQNSEYPRIFRVTGANQNVRKLLSTDLVNTNIKYNEVKNTNELEESKLTITRVVEFGTTEKKNPDSGQGET